MGENDISNEDDDDEDAWRHEAMKNRYRFFGKQRKLPIILYILCAPSIFNLCVFYIWIYRENFMDAEHGLEIGCSWMTIFHPSILFANECCFFERTDTLNRPPSSFGFDLLPQRMAKSIDEDKSIYTYILYLYEYIPMFMCGMNWRIRNPYSVLSRWHESMGGRTELSIAEELKGKGSQIWVGIVRFGSLVN